MMRLLNLYFNQRVMQQRKMFSVAPTSIKEKVNDDDHEASDQVTAELRRSTRTCSAPEWYGNPVLEIMLLDNGDLRTMKKQWRAHIPTNGLKPCNPR